MGLLLAPKQEWGGRLMIVQLSVLVSRVSHAMSRSSCSGQQRRGGPAMQVVNNIIVLCTQFARYPQTACDTGALESDYFVDQTVTFQYRRHPILQQNVDLNLGHKPL